mgnify:CR=1 FL=1
MDDESETPFTTRVIGEIDNGKGHWTYLHVGVFDAGGTQIGEYKRNYLTHYRTFSALGRV